MKALPRLDFRGSLLAALFAAILGACGGNDDETPRTLAIDFNLATTDWVIGLSDYTDDTAPGFVTLEVTKLPPPFSGYALTASGQNHSDDLWVYVKKRFDGFTPGRSYDARLSLRILAGIPQGCFGVGGSPGESVYVKGGVSGIEPKAVRVSGETVMNVDKGSQGQGGPVGRLLGDVTNSGVDCRAVPAEAKTMDTASPIRVQADADGAVWVFFGIDSGYESGAGVTLLSAEVVVLPV